MGLIYLDASGTNGCGDVFIPLMAGNLLGHTFSLLPPGHINIGIGKPLSGEGMHYATKQMKVLLKVKSEL
jgi:hypothetical protein